MSQNRRISLTQEARDYLIEKVKQLEKDRDDERAGQNDLARDERDSTCNAALEDSHQRVDRIEGQINGLNDIIDNSVIVTEDDSPILTVSVGKKVVFHLHHDGEEERVEAVIDGVCNYCGDGPRVITPDSPFGAAVIGAKAGDEKQFISPKGSLVQIVVISVSNR